jgi:hypothetical protein
MTVAMGHNKVHNIADISAFGFVRQALDTGMKGAIALGQHLKGSTQSGDVRAVNTAALKAHKVQPVKIATRGLHKPVGYDIIGDHRDSANDGPFADADELMNTGQAANDHIVFKHTVARHSSRIDDDTAVPDHSVMGDVTTSHKQSVVADPGQATTPFGASVHGDMLANAVAFANLKTAGLALEFQILGDLTDNREGKDDRVFTDSGITSDHDMAFQLNTIGKHNIRTDNTERTDFDILAKGRTVFYDR